MVALLNFNHFISTYGYAAIFLLSVLQSMLHPDLLRADAWLRRRTWPTKGQLSLPGAIVVAVAGR